METGRKRDDATGVIDRRFVELNRRFPLRPIRSDAALAGAHAVIGELMSRGDLDEAEEDYLDVLVDLACKYEDELHPMPDVSAEDMLRHLMEARDLTQADLSRGAGIAEPTVSAILSGKRKLNLNHIRSIAGLLGVDPGLFVAVAPFPAPVKAVASKATKKAHARKSRTR